jgi:GT2 family glycosyltransferase
MRPAFELRFLRQVVERGWAVLRSGRLPSLPLIWRQLQQLRTELSASPWFGNQVAPWYSPPAALKAAVTRQAQAELRAFLAGPLRIRFAGHEQPELSIVVVCFNRAELTLRCLRALAAVEEPSFELVIVDNHSTDATADLLARVDGAIVLRSPTNEGFVRAVNLGAASARGGMLALLNNDAEVLPGSLLAAARALRKPDVGAVVGPIWLADGKLQEAGSIIWRDGSCAGYGRGDRPDAPWYGFARDVDFGSAAFLVTPRAIFHELHGFDERYHPAYYEDVDYCVRLHRSGRRVLYVPDAPIRHFEFASSRDPEEAAALQRAHRQRFVERHADWLSAQRAPGDSVLHARARPTRQRVLFVDDRVPQTRLGSGFPRALALVRAMVDAGCFVTLLATVAHSDARREELPAEVEIVVGAPLPQLLEARRGYYDRILISRPHNLRRLPPGPPGAPLIYDAEALYAERDLQMAGASPAKIRRGVEEELRLARRANLVLAVSQRDADRFSRAGCRTTVLGHSLAPQPTARGFDERDGLLFLGALIDSGSPNSRSIEWFVHEVLPRLRDRAPQLRLTVAGTRPPRSVLSLRGGGVEVLGDVVDPRPLYERARVFVAPTREAAGIPYKIHHAASFGVPVVATSRLADQLGWRNGEELLVADDPEAFAEATLKLYSSPALWDQLRQQALAAVARDCDPQAFASAVAGALA